MIKSQKSCEKNIKTIKKRKVSEMEDLFKEVLKIFMEHVFNACHQASTLRVKIDNLKPGELLFRIDFSENYVCKYSEEVQSVHFRASKKQISFDTGVRYASVQGNIQKLCFASASDNLDHQSHAIGAHMRPILEESNQAFPLTEAVHIFSDSPSSQYRNKNNISFFATVTPLYWPILKRVAWNYTEAGHGKCPMDGVGGALKRGADLKFSLGKDITSAMDFVDALEHTNIRLSHIPSSSFSRLKTVADVLTIQPIQGIMKSHQITWSPREKYMRRLSCFD